MYFRLDVYIHQILLPGIIPQLTEFHPGFSRTQHLLIPRWSLQLEMGRESSVTMSGQPGHLILPPTTILFRDTEI